MGPDLERKAAPELHSASKANTTSPQDTQEKVVDLGIGGRAEERIGPENLEIDVVGFTSSDGHGLSNAESEGATENSSSFGDTISGTEDGPLRSDAEVESPLCGGESLEVMFDGLDGYLPVRKKKLTDHWRRFIRPIMWRCKWIELQLKEFKSQELKYDREVRMHRQRKLIEGSFTLEGVNSKSIPFCGQNRENKVMRRMKRKTVEETSDVASFVSQHSLFSYFASKKSNPLSATLVENLGNPVTAGNGSTNGIDDFEPSIEFSYDPLEHILQKIDGVQAHVQSLKSRVDKVASESPRRFSSINRLTSLAPCDTLVGPGSKRSPESGDRVLPFRSMQSSSYHEVTPLSDIIRSLDQHQIGDGCESTEEEILIHNQAADDELRNFEGASSQQAEKAESVDRKETAVIKREDDLPTDASKILVSTPKSKGPKKRKKGRQYFGPGKRGKKTSG